MAVSRTQKYPKISPPSAAMTGADSIATVHGVAVFVMRMAVA
jgi:hypothetical protein